MTHDTAIELEDMKLACALWAFGLFVAVAQAQIAVPSIVARGDSWVSPYWGYNTPKLLGDGTAWYTAGIWGATPSEATGVIYKFSNGTWQSGAALPGIYQPATLLLDSAGHVIFIHTRINAPVRMARSKAAGDVSGFIDLPSPSSMDTAYYIGAAIWKDVISLAYLSGARQDMWLAQYSLATATWDVPIKIAEGQIETLPKTAWTYPIVLPGDDGVHVVASNSPDGNAGNTYNEVWDVFLPRSGEMLREKLLEAPVGHVAFALDAGFDAAGGLHVLCTWNQPIYGAALPAGSPEMGLYHLWRAAAKPNWVRERLAAPSIAGLSAGAASLDAVYFTAEGIVARAWREDHWEGERILCATPSLPAPLGFLDVATRYSGHRGVSPAFVADGLPAGGGDRVLWVFAPAAP